MGKTLTYLALVFSCALLVGCGGSTSSHSGTVEARPLKGEPETVELVKAMEAIARSQDLAKKVELLDSVQAAGKRLQALNLTESEQKALEDKYGAKKAELLKTIEN
jgi:hypothetical protein